MNKPALLYLLRLVLLLALVVGCAKLQLTQLQEAIRQGDLETTRRLIEQGAAVNEYHLGLTPLCDAVISGNNEDIAELLIVNGADVNPTKTTGLETPLHYAATLGKKNFVKMLITKGGAPNKRNATGYTPRMYAEKGGYSDIVRILKEAEEDGPRRVETATGNLQEVARFEKSVQDYRNASNKPVLPEEARKYKIQAEVAVRDKKYEMAAELYGKGLNIAPWWPEGHFNRALVLGESRYYLTAMREMKRYLQLVPDAPDARAAQDKIYEWELKAK